MKALKMIKYILFTISMIFMLGNVSKAETVTTKNTEIYHLHRGDSVLISVWREEALQKQLVILPDGSLTFPLIGRIDVADLTTKEVAQVITTKLKKFLPDPSVTVSIVSIEGNRMFITGKVIHPGAITISGPTTVLQAISLAGGLDKFADEGGIKLIRNNPEGQVAISINYKDIISGKNLSTNILLKAEDTLIVP